MSRCDKLSTWRDTSVDYQGRFGNVSSGKHITNVIHKEIYVKHLHLVYGRRHIFWQVIFVDVPVIAGLFDAATVSNKRQSRSHSLENLAAFIHVLSVNIHMTCKGSAKHE